MRRLLKRGLYVAHFEGWTSAEYSTQTSCHETPLMVYGYSMGVVKGDDSVPNWDTKAMEEATPLTLSSPAASSFPPVSHASGNNS